jgi:hypothetical protein
MGLFLFAVILGVWGSVPLLRSVLSRNKSFSPVIFQRSLPSMLLLAWGESHLLDCSYIPFNRMAILVWLVYVAVGVFFGVVRANHRARLLRDVRQATRDTDLQVSAATAAKDRDAEAEYVTSGSIPLRQYQTATEPEAIIAGRS